MRRVGCLNGSGRLRAPGCEGTRAAYLIGLWMDDDGVVSAAGRIAAECLAMRLQEDPADAILILDCGRALPFRITRQLPATGWAEVAITGNLPEGLLAAA